jgi:hypothetical protein
MLLNCHPCVVMCQSRAVMMCPPRAMMMCCQPRVDDVSASCCDDVFPALCCDDVSTSCCDDVLPTS